MSEIAQETLPTVIEGRRKPADSVATQPQAQTRLRLLITVIVILAVLVVAIVVPGLRWRIL